VTSVEDSWLEAREIFFERPHRHRQECRALRATIVVRLG
jgi:hypothetical protein